MALGWEMKKTGTGNFQRLSFYRDSTDGGMPVAYGVPTIVGIIMLSSSYGRSIVGQIIFGPVGPVDDISAQGFGILRGQYFGKADHAAIL